MSGKGAITPPCGSAIKSDWRILPVLAVHAMACLGILMVSDWLVLEFFGWSTFGNFLREYDRSSPWVYVHMAITGVSAILYFGHVPMGMVLAAYRSGGWAAGLMALLKRNPGIVVLVTATVVVATVNIAYGLSRLMGIEPPDEQSARVLMRWAMAASGVTFLVLLAVRVTTSLVCRAKLR